jgi:ribose transport system substrate-binding protein
MRFGVRVVVAFAAAASVVVTVTGCRDQAEKSAAAPTTQRVLRIAVIPKATNHEFWKSVHAGAIKAERELPDVQIVWQGPAKEDDREQQINVVENAVNMGVDGIVLAPLDAKALIRPVRDAMAAGIPVVVMDSGLDAEAGKDYVSFVATDNYAAGRKAADLMGERLAGKGRVLVMPYLMGSASTTNREKGFLDGLAARFPGITVVSSDQYGGPTTESCYNKATNLLAVHENVEGIFSSCEPAVFGILRALQETNRAGRVTLIGFDTSDKLVAAMRAGQLHGLVLQDPINIGYLGVQTIVRHLRGESVASRVDTGSAVATPANMDQPRIHELLHPPFEEYLR